MRTHPIQILRITRLADGISLLILLAIAMPLKYIWGIDKAVTIVGSIHGGIFSLYLLAILYAAFRIKWSSTLVSSIISSGNYSFWKFYFRSKAKTCSY